MNDRRANQSVMAPLKILLVTPTYYPCWGGAENQARNQVAELCRRGHSVEVVTWLRGFEAPSREILDGAQVWRINRNGRRLWAGVRGTIALSGRIIPVAVRSDVIAAHHMLSIAYVAGIIAFITRTPIFVLPAGTAQRLDSDLGLLRGSGKQARMRRVLSFPLRARGVAVALSSQIVKDLKVAAFRRIVQIPNGVHDPVPYSKSRLRRDLFLLLGLPAQSKIVVAAGRLERVKGFDVLLDAWPRVTLRCPEAILVVVGTGSEEPLLRSKIAELDVGKTVRLLPSTPDAAKYLASADVVALPSRSEGLSNVLLESMVAGVPVVATRVSGSLDIVRDGTNGRLVPPEDPGALAAALIEVLADQGQMGVRARETIVARYTMSHVIDQYERLMLNMRRVPRGVTTADDLVGLPGPRTEEGQLCAE